MLTIFCTPKPFAGHIAVIQRNAIQSWKALDAGVEIILFGDEDGSAEICREFGLRHEPHVERNEHGGKYVPDIFQRAQRLARHETLCYVNCDILLLGCFAQAARHVAGGFKSFLMVGRRWDLDITEPLNFSQPEWQKPLRERSAKDGRQRGPEWNDYFVFRRGLYDGIPPMVIGRIAWDNWLIWKARARGAAVVDGSAAVHAIHQNHDYGYHPQGQTGVWNDEVAQRNIAAAGGPAHMYTMHDATHRLTPAGIATNPGHRWAPAVRAAKRFRSRVWFAALAATRPLRHPLGLRRDAIDRALAKSGLRRS